ncbi:HNH endonuclease family protein [Leifsonia xyli]|uniref:HNH endonuclease family protein n=1 Tax=Leifsonia xyli TaxID=1575 RepID=UPI0009EF0A55
MPAVAVVLALLLAGCTTTATASRPVATAPATAIPATPSATPPPAAGGPTTALGVLATLPVKGKAPATGYQRTEDFGTAWLDVDHNGCDTRNDILSRDLSDVARAGTCKVLSGTLADPYTGATIHFVRGEKTSPLVQIDHVVALKNAWITGAQQLTEDQRIHLANDPLNLLAVDGPANQQKSDGDAATWLPANKAFRCDYVARQVSVKAAYGLWVAPAEHDAIARVLAGCPGQPASASALVIHTSRTGNGEETRRP